MKNFTIILIAAALSGAVLSLSQVSYAAGQQATTQPKELATSDKAAAKKKSKKPNFARGAKLWANRCTGCHNIRAPKDLTDSEWKATMMHMRVRAGLSGQDARDILEFLQRSN